MKLLCTPYACAYCNDSFSTANGLVSHVQTNHTLITSSEPNNYTSEGKFEGEMEKPLENQSKILTREKIRSGRKNYKEIDNKADVALTELEAINENSMDEIENENPLNDVQNIDVIDGFVRNSKNIIQIVKEPDKKLTKSYKCKKCDKSCISLKILYAHIDNHHKEKKYSCKSCIQKFRYPSKLAIHERVHTGEKPYACRFCNKKFALQQNKIEHERSHTGEKPYACRFCDKKYAGHSNKNHHESICKRNIIDKKI